MRKLAVLGASGHGKVIADCAEMSGWDEVIFFDDAWPNIDKNGHWPVIGNTEDLLNSANGYDGVAVGIGNNSIREKKIKILSDMKINLPVIVHPSAIVSRYASIGKGSVIIAGSVVNIGSILGEGAIINTGASVGHDCTLGNAVHVAPGAKLAGGVSVGSRSWVGVGSAVRQMLKIGSDVMVGVGAAVVKDIPDNVTSIGVPARSI